MSPFIIDVNASNNEMNSKLYMYCFKGEKGYHYRFVSDPTADILVVNENTQSEVFKEFERFEATIVGRDYNDATEDKDLFSKFFSDDD